MMPKQRIFAEFNGVDIEVRNTWFSGAQLFVNDELVDSNKSIFAVSKRKPFLAAECESAGEPLVIEVFMTYWFFLKVDIVVNGDRIGGQ